MKKLGLMLLVAICAISLVSCSGAGNETSEAGKSVYNLEIGAGSIGSTLMARQAPGPCL